MARQGQGAANHESRGRLILIPWHIGHDGDLSINVLRTARRLRAFLAEDPEETRWHFERVLPQGARGKLLLRIPDTPHAGFLRRVVTLLRQEDVGLVASGGVPCFIDPGAWLVRELRERGVPIVPLPGPSGLSTLLSLSGLDWTMGRLNTFTFVYFCRSKEFLRPQLREALGRRGEPLVVFLLVGELRDCLLALRQGGDDRPVSVFFDLTKPPGPRFPFANQVRTLTVRDWLRVHPRVPWKRVSDLALLVHPAPEAAQAPPGRRGGPPSARPAPGRRCTPGTAARTARGARTTGTRTRPAKGSSGAARRGPASGARRGCRRSARPAPAPPWMTSRSRRLVTSIVGWSTSGSRRRYPSGPAAPGRRASAAAARGVSA
ncbi:MAG: SAM-dependent methyltransferase, partial [Myxococcota bacterium]|nr:SAM-dependent methyltransferase [Myxococcota bacterium]